MARLRVDALCGAASDLLRGTDLLHDVPGGRGSLGGLGSNLIGAAVGGFCEYLGMAIGSEALSFVVIAAYLASLMCVLHVMRRGIAATA